MKIKEFKLERLFARYKLQTKYMLSQSACEFCTMKEILAMADDECMALWNNLSLGYTSQMGFPLFREAVAKRYSSIRPSDILEVVPEEGIFIFMIFSISTSEIISSASSHIMYSIVAFENE